MSEGLLVICDLLDSHVARMILKFVETNSIAQLISSTPQVKSSILILRKQSRHASCMTTCKVFKGFQTKFPHQHCFIHISRDFHVP